MTCPPHEWDEVPVQEQDHGNYVEVREYYGVKCRNCPKLRGGEKGAKRIAYRQKSRPAGNLPPWLEKRLEKGELTLRRPESIARHDEAMALIERGCIDAVMTHYREDAAWGVTTICAPQSTYIDPLPPLRAKVSTAAPEAAEWARAAPLRDLEAAARIVNVPDWRKIRWPTRVWNAYVRSNSKAGDTGQVAQRLGCEVPTRASAQWFYGRGIIKRESRARIEIAGETVLKDDDLTDAVSVEAERVNIIENRDLAMLHTEGLTIALDGQPTSAQLRLLSAVVKSRFRPLLWTDADAEGVRIARTVRAVCPVEVIGFAAFPPEWGLKLDAEKEAVLRQEEKMRDDLSSFLEYSRKTGRFWEQERLFAEAQIARRSVAQLVASYPLV